MRIFKRDKRRDKRRDKMGQNKKSLRILSRFYEILSHQGKSQVGTKIFLSRFCPEFCPALTI